MVSKKAAKSKSSKPESSKAKPRHESVERWVSLRRSIHTYSARHKRVLNPSDPLARECADALREAREHHSDSELREAWSESLTANGGES